MSRPSAVALSGRVPRPAPAWPRPRAEILPAQATCYDGRQAERLHRRRRVSLPAPFACALPADRILLLHSLLSMLPGRRSRRRRSRRGSRRSSSPSTARSRWMTGSWMPPPLRSSSRTGSRLAARSATLATWSPSRATRPRSWSTPTPVSTRAPLQPCRDLPRGSRAESAGHWAAAAITLARSADLRGAMQVLPRSPWVAQQPDVDCHGATTRWQQCRQQCRRQ